MTYYLFFSISICNSEVIHVENNISISSGVLMCLDNTYHLAWRHFCNFLRNILFESWQRLHVTAVLEYL